MKCSDHLLDFAIAGFRPRYDQALGKLAPDLIFGRFKPKSGFELHVEAIDRSEPIERKLSRGYVHQCEVALQRAGRSFVE